jgi:hypothetical protein
MIKKEKNVRNRLRVSRNVIEGKNYQMGFMSIGQIIALICG